MKTYTVTLATESIALDVIVEAPTRKKAGRAAVKKANAGAYLAFEQGITLPKGPFTELRIKVKKFTQRMIANIYEHPVPQSKRQMLEATPWAKNFKINALYSYETALNYALDPKLRVNLSFTNENGSWVYAIVAASHDPTFWLDAQPTKKAALTLCKKMGWALFKTIH